VASLSQGRTAAAQCGLFTYKSVPVIFEPPCILQPFVSSPVVRKKLDSDTEKARCVTECDDSGSPFVEQRVNQIYRFGLLVHLH